MARLQHTRPIIYQALLALVLLAVGSLVAGGGISFAAPQYSLTCSSCHGMPPADSPTGTRDPDTRAVKGNHLDHLPSGVPVEGCVICHGSAASSYPTGHRDDVIQISSNINSSPATGTYSRGTFFNQTSASLPTLGTCANVNCHFESASPAWGTTAFASPADCNRCHGAAPNTGSHPVSGAKHANYYGTTTSSCVKCHPSHTIEAKPFAHATSAGQRNLSITFAAFPNNGSGSYSGPLNDYLPSQVNTFGGCSALYCHSPGDKASAYNAPNQAATWGASLGANCTGCHKGDKGSLDAMASGVHTKHVNSYIFPCQNCHSVTVSSGNRTLFANYTAHVNRSVNIAYASGIHVGGTYNGTASPMQKALGSAVGSCANIYCHSDGTKAPTVGPFAPRVTPAWTAGALDATCSGCHLGDATAFKPMSTATHYKHVKRYTFNCVNCHSVTLQSGSRTLFANNTAHVNRSVNVAFDAAYYGTAGSYNGAASPMQKAPGSAYGNCANIYCHSEGRSTSAPFKAYSTPKWGGTLPSNCTGCHGGDATTFKNISTGKHKAHMNNTGVLGLGNNFKCGDCHLKTVNTTSNTVITGQSNHVNTLKDYSGARAGRIGTFSGQITCGNNYCHSSGQATPVFRNMTGVKRWSGTANLGCASCHGYGTGAFTPVAGEPNYAGSNSHQKHTVDTGMADSRGCANCHRVTVDKGVANKLKNYSSAHLNRVRDVAFSVFSNKTGHYTAGAKTCGNTYCHGAGNSPAWGSAGPLACNTCHSANNVLAGAHGQHWETATPPTSYTATPGNGSASGATYEFACSSCHQATHAGGSATAFGDAQVQFGYTSATRKGIYTHAGSTAGTDNGYKWTAGTNGACATTYCHSDGRGGNPVNTTFAWNTANGTLRCTGCHDGTMTLTSGKHQAHVNNAAVLDTNFGCADCHAKTVFTNNTTLGDKRKHVNKFKDYSGAKAGGSANYVSATGVCSNLYCHSTGQASPVFRNMTGSKAWIGTGTLGCDGCHGYKGTLYGAPNYANLSTATRNDFNSHSSKHISVATDCSKCHAATVGRKLAGGFAVISSPTASHVDRSRQVAFGAYSGSYDNAAKRCANVYCHSSVQNATNGTKTGITYATPRWGGAVTCASCHVGQTTPSGSGSHVQHVTNGGFTNCGICHKGAGAATAFHADKAVQVAISSTRGPSALYNGAPPYGNGYSNCASTYCHGNTSPTWGANTAKPACEKCHGFRMSPWPALSGATASTDPKAGAHFAHLSSATNMKYAKTFTCAECHIQPATPSAVGHIDNAVPAELTFGSLANTGTTSSYSNGTCSSVYCHGATRADGSPATKIAFPNWSTPFLTGNAATDCGKCHGNPPNTAGHGSVTANQCNSCHSHVNNGTAAPYFNNIVLHINGVLDGGISNGGQTCYGCHGAYQTAMEDGSLTKTGATRANFYHHVVGSATQEGDIAPNTGAYPTSTSDVFCVSCHTDHNYFNAAKGANLRTGIAAAGSSVSSTDYSSTAPYGICVSCHSSKLTKQGMGTDQRGFGSYTTPVIDGAAYGTSMHNYTSNSAFGSSAFQANCSKCHTDEQTKDKQTSAQKFGTHYSAQISVLNTMGITAPGEYLEENFCYRCHSKTTDTTPGGGPAKTVANKDYFGSQAMVASSEDIFTAFKGIGVSSYTTTASATLYLRDTAAINTVPPGTRPASYKYSSGTYTTNVFNDRDMAPTSGATNGGGTISTGATAARYNRGYQFVSPQIDNTVTIPSGSTFTLTIRESRATGTSTDYTRLTVYKWNGVAATPLNTSAAPNNFAQNATAISTTATNRSTIFTTNSAVTLNPGDVLVCDVEFYHSAGTTALNVTYAFGLFATDGAQLALPAGTYNWRTGSSTKAGHNVAAYSGKHKINETLAYIAANKHVECADCHNPHAAGQAKHTQGTNAVSAILSGVPGAIPSGTYGTTGTGTNWSMGTTNYSLGTATKEYQVCFKCHSGANTSLATWNAAWTDAALEFNPSNQSYHPVVAALPATDPGANGSSQLAASQTLTGGWARGQTMYCSDCHGNDAASPAAQGPHGSAQAFILKGTNTYWPKNSSGALYTLGNNPTNNSHLAGLFCMNCHVVQSATGASVNNAHTEHAGPQLGDVTCVSCHILVPHGGKISRLIGDKNTMPTRYAYQGTLTNMYIDSFTKAATPTGYVKGNCYSTTAACSTHSIAASENW